MAHIDQAVELVRGFLSKQTGGIRPVPLAQAIGEKDIRVVRAALEQMEQAGDLVTCKVIVDGEEDKEFRLVAGGKVQRYGTYFQPPAPRRGDVSHIPSHFGKSAPAAVAAPAAATKDRVPPRQQRIIEVIEQHDRSLTTQELLEIFHAKGDYLALNTIQYAVLTMIKNGRLVECERVRSPGTRKRTHYATPAIAARIKDTKGSGGEATPAVHPVPGEAGEAPAAPLEPARSSETPPVAQNAIVVRLSERGTAHELLEQHLRGCVGAWCTLRWLVPVVAGDVPSLLEQLAVHQRMGRLEFGLVDGAPMWRVVEGRW